MTAAAAASAETPTLPFTGSGAFVPQAQFGSSKIRTPTLSPVLLAGPRTAATRSIMIWAPATASSHRSPHMLPDRSSTSMTRCGVVLIVTVSLVLALRKPGGGSVGAGHVASNHTSCTSVNGVSA